MSEFSESYHLRGDSRLAATTLLREAKLPGFVFPALDGWVTLVAEGDPFVANEHLVSSCPGVLLRWVYGEDHGWGFYLYQNGEPIIEYFCAWDTEVSVQGKVNHSVLEGALGIRLPTLAGEAGVKLFYPSSIEEIGFGDSNPAYVFAQSVGLTYYKWLSHHYLSLDKERGEKLPIGVVEV